MQSPRPKIFKLGRFLKEIVALVLLMVFAVPAMARNFTEVTKENMQYFISTIPTLPDAIEPRRDKFFHKKSPIKAYLYGNQNGNQIEFKVILENGLDQPWFYESHNWEYFVLYADEESIGWYPPGPIEPGFSGVSRRDDSQFELIEAKESLTFNFTMPAEWFYTYYKDRVISIAYQNAESPPSLDNMIEEERNRKGYNPKNYTVIIRSNMVNVRCHDYNESKGLYSCEVQTLPNIPVFK